MNITNYVVTVFKDDIITDSHCSLKTALHPVLINEIRGIVFSSLTSAIILSKTMCITKNLVRAAG